MSSDVTKFPGPALRLPKRTPITDRFIEFTCLVVVPGRAFLRRMIDLTKSVNKKTVFHVALNHALAPFS